MRLAQPMGRALVALAAAVAVAPVPAAGATLPAGVAQDPPMLLPPAGASAAKAKTKTWLLGTRSGVRRVATGRARAEAALLRARGDLVYAEPDISLRRSSSFDAAPDQWARPAILPPLSAPPPARVPIGIVDDVIDRSHPDVGPNTRLINEFPAGVLDAHGTMVASAAAALFNGFGVFGVYHGAPIYSYAVSPELTCGEAARGVDALVNAGAGVINLSFGSAQECFTLFRSVQLAFGANRVVVSSAGNEFTEGNPIIYPAAWPHVVSVAGLAPNLQAAYFSEANLAVDVAAPGQGIPVATPVAFDRDGTPDGVTIADGTSFASPMVAGAAAWLAAQRPELRASQVADVLRKTARDVGPSGYDQGTGFGLVTLQSALAAPAPRLDPSEPNDGIAFVDGTAFSRADPYVWTGNGRRNLRASVDRVEDPVDVYRIRVPARAVAKIRLHPSFGDPDLRLYHGSSTSFANGRLLARSVRGTGRIDVIDFVNRTARARRLYVVVTAETDRNGTINASYRLEFLRRKRR